MLILSISVCGNVTTGPFLIKFLEETQRQQKQIISAVLVWLRFWDRPILWAMPGALWQSDRSYLGRWWTPGRGRAVATAAALMTEFYELWGLCGLLRLLAELQIDIRGCRFGFWHALSDNRAIKRELDCFAWCQRRGHIKQQIGTHTSVTEQQAASAAASPVTGTKPEAVHSIALFAWSEPSLEVISIFPLVYLAADECFWAECQVFE